MPYQPESATMTDCAPDDSDEQVRQFAEQLAELRTEAGNPSFRQIARESGCISHTALHAAVQGKKLPSWETVQEFVRACSGDEETWRARWLAASETSARPTVAAAEPEPREGEARGHRRHIVITAVVSAALTAVVVLAGLALLRPADNAAEAEAPGAAAPTEAAGPLVPGDSIQFVRDVTLEDGSVIPRGQTRIKTWEFENTGTVLWEGRRLQRVDSDSPCRSPQFVEVGTTPPRDRVKVSIEVTAPDEATDCVVHFKMVTADGDEAFPGRRPVFYQVSVR